MSNFSIDTTGDIIGVVTLPRQLLYAATKAVNDTADDSRDNVIILLKHNLHVRGNWIRPKTRYGINVTYAKKGTYESAVHTAADWLLEEEGFHGGIKKAELGHTNLANPSVENTRHGIENKVKAAEKARKLLQFAGGKYSNLKTRNVIGKTGAFKIRNKAGTELILQRVGATASGEVRRGKKGQPLRTRGANGKIVLKYVLKRSVKVPQEKIFQHGVIFTTREVFGKNYGKNLVIAIRNAKKR